MKREEIVKAIAMRYDGYSYDYIAKMMGYSKQHINCCLRQVVSKAERGRFHDLYARIKADYGSISKFCEKNDLSLRVVTQLFRPGKPIPPKAVATVLRVYPTATYNELFG